MLFDKNYHYTRRAIELDKEASELLEPLFEKFTGHGESPRDISHILQERIKFLEQEAILELYEKGEGRELLP
jgi:hypothetical protein